VVSSGYFRALGIPLREGRDLSAGLPIVDTTPDEREVVVNEAWRRRSSPPARLGQIIRGMGGA
jgi:hypothetical protein